MRYLRVVLAAVLLLGAVFCQAGLRVEQGYVRAMPPGHPTTAAFMRLVNSGDKDVVIDAASSDAAARVEFHAHVHKDGMMSMRQLPSITVPAGGEFVLEPGVCHLMLIDLNTSLREGDTVTLQLFSGNNEVLNAKLPVRSILN